MFIDLIVAVLAGFVGTTFMTAMMLAGKQLGLPAIDVHSLLGYVTRADRRTSIGYIGHWLLGALFAIGYVVIFRTTTGNLLLRGIIIGIVHWLLVGGLFAFAPTFHAGMRAGTVKAAGPYMLNTLGWIGFIGGMAGHIVFGATVALIFGLFNGGL